jgi:hypothetical protein
MRPEMPFVGSQAQNRLVARKTEHDSAD